MTKHKLPKHPKNATNSAWSGFLSPFRYPGGKSWFIKTVRQWISGQQSRPSVLVEPFAGGACISLAAVQGNLVRHAVFSELDVDVAATWETMLNGEANWLAKEITSFRMNRKNVEKIIAQTPIAKRRRAFRCILRNRTARGGVIADGAGLIREGEDGNGVGSRWYAETLGRRIRAISSLREKLKFTQSDGFALIRKHIRSKRAVFFVDPPYTKAARRLYNHWEIDHEKLFELLRRAKGNVLMTYDDTAEIRSLAAKHGFYIKRISMRTTHHQTKRELMISKNFDWQVKPRKRLTAN